MNFPKAMIQIKAGKRVARTQWPAGTYMEATSHREGGAPYHKVVNGRHAQWLGVDSHIDAHADDWVQVGG